MAGTFLPDAWRSLASPVPLRYPEKLAVPMTLALAVLAGVAFDRVRAAASRRGPGRIRSEPRCSP